MNFRKLVITQEDEDEESKDVVNRISMNELLAKQEKLRSYPPILLHTLFHNHKQIGKFRKVEFSNLYFFSDELKGKGNKRYQKNIFYLALDYYE